jgi:2-isopropylmalate synthase
VHGIDNVVISVHCHNDLGLAVANSLAAVRNGARQVEGCINGIGERAGNAALEEVIMALNVRRDIYGVDCNVDTTQLYPTSQMLSAFTDSPVQRNKAVVGANAFAHESGIHQDGMLKDMHTYEIMEAAMIGAGGTRLVLGKHSGRHALRVRLNQMGHQLSQDELNLTFKHFKDMADTKREINDDDLEEILVRTHAGATRAIGHVYR